MMSMRNLKAFFTIGFVGLAVSCGGGGGDPGSIPFGSGSGTGSGGGTGGGTAAAYTIAVEVQRSGASTTQVATSETVQAVATVQSKSGAAVEGVVVTFGESGPGLTKLAPVSGTALTDAAGKAQVDLTGSSASATGATTVTASASISGTSVTSSKSIQLTAASTGPATALPAAINFVGAAPSGVAIVIKGAGGTGRSESAILTYKVVDANNAPIAGAALRFAINVNNGGASIQPLQAVTNASGLATTTVSSGTQPASIVVQASTAGANNTTVSTQSDTLIVSNDVPVVGGFEIVAVKYNLDGRFTGDTTKITAFVRDQNGNPVPDGVAVNFTTDYGVVASSTLGGCVTANGQCFVTFTVQEPRGTGIATVVAQIRVGDTVTLTDSIQINMAGSVASPVVLDLSGLPINNIALTGTCKASFELLLSDGNGHSTAAGTTVAIGFKSTGAAPAVGAGTPVLDQLGGGFPPTTIELTVDLTSIELVAPCDATKASAPSTNYFNLEVKSPHGIITKQRIGLTYPH
jgi:hypothetical protein